MEISTSLKVVMITLIIIINLQDISSSIICMKSNTIHSFCRTDEGKLIPYNPEYLNSENSQGKSVEYVDDSVKIIRASVFNDPSFYHKTKSLKLRLSNENLTINSSAFQLSRLENLEITPGSVRLELNTFKELSHLKSLKLKVNEAVVKLYQILPNFPKLESLELIENEIESICDPSGKALTISSLNYTASRINKLSSGSFKCLPKLKSLIITETNLSRIEVGAFENLKKLETLRLTSNWNLKNISGYFFKELKNLQVLDLANNSILGIDNDAFHPMNENCKLLNLSYNLLEYLEFECFKNLKCETVDLGGNDIQNIENNAFENSIILRMFLDQNTINKFDNGKEKAVKRSITESHYLKRWGLKNSTTVYLESISFETSSNLNKDPNHCSESDHGLYVICKERNIIISVKQQVLPHRLLPKTLKIYDNGIFGIESNSFVDLSIERLMILSSPKNFKIQDYSFVKMKKLKSLQLITSPIRLSEDLILPIKDTLESLTLSLNESNVYLCEVLPMFENLKMLVLNNHDDFRFHHCCVKNNSDIKLESLRYNGGSLEVIQPKSFECLKMMQQISIHGTSLSSIHSGAFKGLDNLQILNIQFNKDLTLIKRGALSGLINLDILILKSNAIAGIEDEAFIDFKRTISLVDVSRNKIQSVSHKTFKGVSIEQLDISNNVITFFDYEYIEVGTLYTFNNDKIVYNDNGPVAKVQSSCHTEGILIICVKDKIITFVSYNENAIVPDIELSDSQAKSIDMSVKISVNNISSIDKNACVFMNMKYRIKTLIISKDNKNKFTFDERSFAPLKKLKNLELNIGPITLKSNQFENFELLRFLAIQVDERKEFLSRSFGKLNNLKALEIFKNNSVGICNNPYAHMVPSINKLLYTGGSIIILHRKSLICLPYLEIFKITATNLATLEEDAFFGLGNLLTINLSHNNLTNIPNNVFSKLEKLKKLTLHHNFITTIEMGALVLNHGMSLVNISHNKLEYIEAGTFRGMICDYLDLSGNTILSNDRNILDLTDIKKRNINGHVSSKGQAMKVEDPPEDKHYVSWTNWPKGCNGKPTYAYKYAKITCPGSTFKTGSSRRARK